MKMMGSMEDEEGVWEDGRNEARLLAGPAVFSVWGGWCRDSTRKQCPLLLVITTSVLIERQKAERPEPVLMER